MSGTTEIQHLIDQMVDAGWSINLQTGGSSLGSLIHAQATKGGALHSRQALHIEDAVVLLHYHTAQVDKASLQASEVAQ